MAVDDSYTKSLLHFDGSDASQTFTDESGKTWTAYNHAQLDTAYKKFGTASGLFDGIDDAISTPDHSDFALGSGDFTFDFWIKRNGGLGEWQTIFAQVDSDGAVASCSIWAELSGENRFSVDIGSGANWVGFDTELVFTDTTIFHHVAIIREGIYMVCAFDGVFDSWTADMTGITVNNSSNLFAIGKAGDGDYEYLNANIDELRFSPGIARWTEDFTPPPSPYGSPIKKYMGVSYSNIKKANTVALASIKKISGV
jgi:hypothetical protein